MTLEERLDSIAEKLADIDSSLPGYREWVALFAFNALIQRGAISSDNPEAHANLAFRYADAFMARGESHGDIPEKTETPDLGK